MHDEISETAEIGLDVAVEADLIEPPFSPMNSTQFRSSRPFRQKQIPSSDRVDLVLLAQ